MPQVAFEYRTGLKTKIVNDARLTGSWDEHGRSSERWAIVPMASFTADDGCPAFRAEVDLDATDVGREFRWGVYLDTPTGGNLWGITEEVNDHLRCDRYRSFVLLPASSDGPQEERYYLTFCRRLGAQKHHPPGADGPALRFAVWAPNARQVEVVFGTLASGYIADDGTGIDPAMPVIALHPRPGGVWESDLGATPALRRYADFDQKPYMYRITRDDGSVAYRTDLYSRYQVGTGKINPRGTHYDGTATDVDGRVSCSLVIDPDLVTRAFRDPVVPETDVIPANDFWAGEFDHARPLPTRLENLVIYELHIGALGFDRPGDSGKIADALDPRFLDHLADLGINAVELLPMAEFGGDDAWGYGNSHHFAIQSRAGGTDQFKHFVRACHRRGIAVIMDVVYNHYVHDAERAEWAYDSPAPERNSYYWYEGLPSDYPAYEQAAAADPARNPRGHGGYVDNYSSGYAPRYHDAAVRQMFVSSAAALIEECHVDGFRLDLTNAIHALNVCHGDGQPVGLRRFGANTANIHGAKFLRQWTRTVELIRPETFVIAEDHSDWDKLNRVPDAGGLGFDAAWYVNFYHHLIGDGHHGPEFAKLLSVAGTGTDAPLAMGYFAGACAWSGHAKVVYHESHDEAGNAEHSQRTIRTAVNGASLVGLTRRYAEARCRFVAGMSILSAATPMFLMGEEVGAQKDYTYDNFVHNREDLLGERERDGANLFAFYQKLIRLRKAYRALHTRNVEVLHSHDVNRVIAFHRWSDSEDLLVIGGLNNRPFESGYVVHHPALADGWWREIFNSDSALYGGDNVGNAGAALPVVGNTINAFLPANGFVVFQRL